MKFSFLIPTIRQYDMLFRDCIDSLVKHHAGEDYEIIVVEDGSEKAFQSRIVQECTRRGNIKLLLNETNLGFPRSVNRGLEAASGDYIILTNNDIVFTQNVTKAFQNAFNSNEKIGIVGSLLFYPHGTIQHGGIISLGRGHFTHRGWHKTFEQSPEVQKPGYLISVTGALFAIRREALQAIGPMNPEYFLACDDTEYCLRAWTKDWRVYYSPDIRAIHAEGATRGANDRDKLIKNRHWFIKERETFTKFQNDVQAYDWDALHRKVNACNLEMLGATLPPEGECNRKVYGDSLVTDLSKPKNSGRVIGVRRTGALGDVLLASPIIRKLKEQNPDYDIVVATLCGDVFRNSPRVAGIVKTLEEIPNPEKVYDLDMVYEQNPKCHIAEAYAKYAFGECSPDLDLSPEIFSSEQDYASLKSKLGSINPEKDRVIVVHMGVGWASRTWPRNKWCEVVKQLAGNGFKIVVVGRGADYRSDLYGGVLNLVDYLSVHESRELMRRSSAFIGMDSGMFHVAMTTNIPTVGIFTVANPDYRVSKRKSGKTIALFPKVDCRFCLHDQKPPVTFVACQYGTNHCLEDFSVNDVVKAAVEIAR